MCSVRKGGAGRFGGVIERASRESDAGDDADGADQGGQGDQLDDVADPGEDVHGHDDDDGAPSRAAGRHAGSPDGHHTDQCRARSRKSRTRYRFRIGGPPLHATPLHSRNESGIWNQPADS